jgi:hypothetical protein
MDALKKIKIKPQFYPQQRYSSVCNQQRCSLRIRGSLEFDEDKKLSDKANSNQVLFYTIKSETYFGDQHGLLLLYSKYTAHFEA